MRYKSLWQSSLNLPSLDSLDETINTDILIIGGGITGISTAYNLIGKNEEVVLIDRDSCLNGVTARTTGKLTYLQELSYQNIEKIFDFETAKLYLESQKEAIRIVKKNIKDNSINCDFTKNDSLVFTMDKKELPKFNKEREFLDKVGIKYKKSEQVFDNLKPIDTILVQDSYVFHPLKYLKFLLKKVSNSNNIRIYEKTIAVKMKKENGRFVVLTEKGNNIIAKKVVLACNYSFFTIPGLFPLKTFIEKSYIVATKVEKQKNINGITSNYPYKSFRYHSSNKDNYFIYLACSKKLCDGLNHEKNYELVLKQSKSITGKSPSYGWMNMDVFTNDGLPFIGRYLSGEPNLFIGTGYNAWGMTNGTIAGKIISDLILGKKNKYEKLFDPTRHVNIKNLKGFVNNTAIGNTKAYTFSLLKKNPSWYNGKAMVICKDGKRVGVYVDEDGKGHVVSNVCPHLKCFLTFNTVDKTWDCPCHGSRFDINGNSIKGPSVYNIKIVEKDPKTDK